MNDIQIRVALLADEPIIYQLISTLEETVFEPTTFRSIFEQNLTNPSIYYFVAESTAEVLGFISCHVQVLLHHCGKVGEIQELFVRPDVRNRGVGQRLVNAVKTLAVRDRWASLEVTTNQKRVNTIRFYERELFTQTHVKLINTL